MPHSGGPDAGQTPVPPTPARPIEGYEDEGPGYEVAALEAAAAAAAREEAIRGHQLEIEARLRLASAREKEAEAKLAEIRANQANDDRILRIVTAGLTFLLVVGWLLWLGGLIMDLSLPGTFRRRELDPTVTVALIAHASVALIGLFLVILRGLFKVSP